MQLNQLIAIKKNESADSPSLNVWMSYSQVKRFTQITN